MNAEDKLREELGMTRIDIRSDNFTRYDERYQEEIEYINNY